MSVVSVKAQLTTQELMDAIGQLGPVELEQLVRYASRLRRQKISGQSPREKELVKAARQCLSPVFLRRYRELIAKRRAETLTKEEYEELLRLGDESEVFNVKRFEALAALARLRQTDIDVLMKELGIKPAPYE